MEDSDPTASSPNDVQFSHSAPHPLLPQIYIWLVPASQFLHRNENRCTVHCPTLITVLMLLVQVSARRDIIPSSEQYGTVGRVLIKCDCCSRARSVFRQTSCGWEEREEKIKIKNSVSQRSFLYLWLCSMKKKRWKKMLIVIVEIFSPRHRHVVKWL